MNYSPLSNGNQSIKTTLRTWMHPYFSNPERFNLWICLLFITAILTFFGALLTPLMVSVILAYLLQWPVSYLEHLRVPRRVAVLVVYSIFMSLLIGICVLILPVLLKQLQNLLTELPQIINKSKSLLAYLQQHYPKYISTEQLDSLNLAIKKAINYSGQWALSALFTSIQDIIALPIYFILVPLLIYFFLMDQKQIIHWLVSFLPEQKRLISEVWTEVYTKTGHYVRGKALEIMIVWIVSAIAFAWIKLPYAMLLGFLAGISAVIPYVGTIIVTIPILTIGFFEWGWSRDFAFLVIVYSSITVLDAHVLFPLLFAEAMALHPVAIMLSTLVFGGILGFWGIFFSIPLAVLSNTLLNILKQSQIKHTEEL